MADLKVLSVKIPTVYHKAFKRYTMDNDITMQEVINEFVEDYLLEKGVIKEKI